LADPSRLSGSRLLAVSRWTGSAGRVIGVAIATRRRIGGSSAMSGQIPKGLDIQARPLGHLSLVVSLIDELGITDVVRDMLPKDPRSNVSDADCVAAMVMNVLGGRTALYRMEQWTKKLPVDVLIGRHCAPEDFSDARLAKTLDHLHAAGTDNVLAAIVKRYLTREERPHTYSLHQDMTSVSVFGAYEGEVPQWTAEPLFGYSKDHRPDLKQLVFGLTLHGAVGMPMVGTMFDGNTSDKYANAFHIESLAALLPDEDVVTLVADSKLVDPQLLGTLLDQEMHFISLVPRTYKARALALEKLAEETGELPELGRTPGRRKADPDTLYRGRSYNLDFHVRSPGQETSKPVPLRFVAIHSDALAAKFEASLPKKLAKERQAIEKAVEKANKKPFSCENDASAAVTRVTKTGRLRRPVVVTERYELPGKRPRGRPRNEAPAPAPEVLYRLVLASCEVDEGAVEGLRRSKSHLVLISDHLDRDTHSDADILAEYRHQYLIEGHTGFRWLKGPAQVAPVFLKSPGRITGLGLVMMLSLMVRNYLQFTVRAKLAEHEETLPYYDRKRETARPTAEVVWELFSDLVLLVLTLPGDTVVHRLQGLSDAQRRVLQMLDLDISALTQRNKSAQGSG